MSDRDAIRAFFEGSPFAVVGASNDRSKYGNKVLRTYRRDGREAYAVNPRQAEVEGQLAYPDLASLPEPPHGVSIVTPPAVTAQVVDEALALGVRHLWMQPGAEDEDAIERARAAGASVIANGPCVLVELG